MSIILKDLNRYSETLSGKFKVIFFSASFHSVLLYRISNFLYNKVPVVGNLLSVVFEYLNIILYSCDVSRKCTIGSGFMIVHCAGIIIGERVKVGKNCKIFNCVNLGNKNTETGEDKQPIIKNDVVLGAGAKCLGDIEIGNNVTIGANSVVLTDVPDHCIAVGVPAKVIFKKRIKI
jgi:serine O-acetyltransferase